MRLPRHALALGSLGLLALAQAGCPRDACLLRLCDGGQCQCSISSCGSGAAFDTSQNRCRCTLGHLSVAGQCFDQAEANAYCGRAHHFASGGCVADPCKPGDEIDHSTGSCVSREQVNQVAARLGVALGPGQKLGCPKGSQLVLDGPTAACVPLSQTCARDETWTGQSCAKLGQCALGAAWDPTAGKCLQYAQGNGGGGELRVDVAAWATGTYGPNGGQGTAAFCSAFSKHPVSFGLVAGASALVRVAVLMSLPDGEIARGVVQTVSAFDASGNQVPGLGAALVQQAAHDAFAPLQKIGGRAAAATASTLVRCQVVNAAKPVPVPATGGL